ncbi:DUF3768 domain-containing protein [Cellulophaga sp. F20128]|uniref:DUF3768 domain-containing protein n=1 Tax=Cellulophaga sp. F20128 TaxID=2926413 RepID=UPI001FF5A2C3|nr:DUF3768 domain-containing protein [Cellulophaga sp. F20128]MCK0157129.1 DUF3768 domain-containing protein [Cellulophaga sp. F20128]
MSTNTKAIAFLNDAYRADIGSSRNSYPDIKGKCTISTEISSLSDIHVAEIIYRTQSFNGFDKYNDPNGEHKQGRFYYAAIAMDVVWEIHYYRDYFDKIPCEDPSDVSKTIRHLLITLAPRT